MSPDGDEEGMGMLEVMSMMPDESQTRRTERASASSSGEQRGTRAMV